MIDKNKYNIEVPDYKEAWYKLYNEKKDEIIEALQNMTSISLVCSDVSFTEIAAIKKGVNYTPNLLTISKNMITSRYYPDEFIQLILEHTNPDITSISVNSNILNNEDIMLKLELYRNLYEITIIGDYKLTKEDILSLICSPSLGIIHTRFVGDIDIEELPDAIKYIGNTEAILYDGMLITNDRYYESDRHTFYTDDLMYNLDTIFDYIKHNKIINNNIKYLNLIGADFSNSVYYDYESGKLEYFGSFPDIKVIIEKFEEVGLQVKEIDLELQNKDYDLSSLHELDIPIVIEYDYSITNLESFESMRETINYFKSVITAYPLSPIEQVTYAYDIIKSFEYEEDEEDKNQSRDIDKIIKSGKIVCVGYALFLKQVLSELGFKIDDFSVLSPNGDGTYDQNTTSNHRRNMIRIDDDKYNIHGIFALDPTWDRTQDLYKVRDSEGNTYPESDPEDVEILKKYQTFISYVHFLVTKNEYQALFEDYKTPPLFRFGSKELLNEINGKPRFSGRSKELIDKALEMIQLFFEPEEYILLDQYINTQRPSLDVFKEILYNVERAEGFAQIDSERALQELEEYNRGLNEHAGTPVFDYSKDTNPWLVEKEEKKR